MCGNRAEVEYMRLYLDWAKVHDCSYYGVFGCCYENGDLKL